MPTFDDYFVPDSVTGQTGVGQNPSKSLTMYVRDLKVALKGATGVTWRPQQGTQKARYIHQLVIEGETPKAEAKQFIRDGISPHDGLVLLFRAFGGPYGHPFEVDVEASPRGKNSGGIANKYYGKIHVDPSRDTLDGFASKVAAESKKAMAHMKRLAIPYEPYKWQRFAARVARRYLMAAPNASRVASRFLRRD